MNKSLFLVKDDNGIRKVLNKINLNIYVIDFLQTMRFMLLCLPKIY